VTAADLLHSITSTAVAEAARSAGAAPAIALPAELTIYNVAATGALFSARLAEGGDLELDASAVAEVDAAGIQLLLAGRRHARAWDRRFLLHDATNELQAALSLLGLSFDVPPGNPPEDLQ
jgi:ABC-type transporter Mla MlaB component